MKEVYQWFFPCFLLVVVLQMGCTFNSQSNNDNSTLGDTETTVGTFNSLPAISLFNTWYLESFGKVGEEKTLIEGTTIYVELGRNPLSVSGFASCNQYANYTIVEPDPSTEVMQNQIPFANIAKTDKGCSEEINQQEEEYMSLLRQVVIHEVISSERKLNLWDANQENVLRYHLTAPEVVTITELPGTKWKLQNFETISGEFVIAEGIQSTSPLTLEFEKDTTLQGFGGCNTFIGEYQLNGENEISISNLTATKIVCDFLEQEEKFFENLTKITKYQLQNDRLKLTNGQNTMNLNFLFSNESD